jgi:prepilin-type processing-associated H-X9-DG protein
VPAVQKVREAANVMTCKNNLKQLGIAIHNFASAYKCFPPAGVTGYTSNAAGITNWRVPGNVLPTPASFPLGTQTYSFGPPSSGPALPYSSHIPFLLPYIEQGSLAAGYDLTLPWFWSSNVSTGFPHGNLSVSGTQIPMLYCPSALSPNRYDHYVHQDGLTPDFQTTNFGVPGGACTDYAAISTGIGGQTFLNDLLNEQYTDPYTNPSDLAAAPILGVNRCTRPIQVTDGLSNTLMVCESASRPLTCHLNSCTANTYNSAGQWAQPTNLISPQGSDFTGATDFVGPCTMNCTNVYNIYSFHSGGCNFLAGDGSVHFVSADIGWVTLARLFTKDRGEVNGYSLE